MSSNLQQMPDAATKISGGLRIVQHKHAHNPEQDNPAPQTDVEKALSTQQELEKALGIHEENPTPSVRDAAEHPKANASTFNPADSRGATGHRGNASHTAQIQQPGGAYGARRH